MKFIIQVIAIAALAYILELMMPWWSIALATFLIGYFLKSKANFLAGLLGIILLWGVSAWMIDASAAAPLAEKVAAIFKLPKVALILITGIIGGLVGGFACMAGASLKKEKRRY